MHHQSYTQTAYVASLESWTDLWTVYSKSTYQFQKRPRYVM